MYTAYKCRAYPTDEQAALLSRTFGCVRVVWNQTLAWRHARYATDGTGTSFAQASKFLTALKKQEEFIWLNQAVAVPLQQTIKHQQMAFTDFFAKRSKYPRFKTRNSRQSATFSRAGMRMKDGELLLQKAGGPLRFIWTWPDIDITQLNPSSVTVSRDPSGRWYASFRVEIPDLQPLPITKKQVGIDLGLTDIVVTSEGEKVTHPRHMDQHERRLKRYQRMMARRKPKLGQESSNRYRKAKRHVAKQHGKVADSRRDHLHKLTSKLVRENDVIAIEDLNTSGMIQNRKLSKAIGRTGWGELRRQLEYKCEWYERELKVIDRWYPSSKTCSSCGHLLKELSLKTRSWTCPGCGTRHDRDINAAKNILKVATGLADTQNARGADVRPTRVSLGRPAVKREASLETKK